MNMLSWNSLSGKLLVSLLLSSVLLTAILTTARLPREYANTMRDIERGLKLIERTNLPTLIENVWVMDQSRLQRQLENIAEVDFVQYVAVIDGEQRRLAEAGVLLAKANTEERLFDLTYRSDGKDVPIGTLRLFVNLDLAADRVQEQLGVILISQGVAIFLISLAMLYVVRVVLIRHLNEIVAYVQSLDIRHLDRPLRMKRPQELPVELQALTDGINLMRTSLMHGTDELAQLNNTLEQKVDERTERLSAAYEELDAQHNQLKETQTQLVQSEKMASLGILVAGVAHEINNPNNFISMNAHNLKRTYLELEHQLYEIAGEDAAELKAIVDAPFRKGENYLADIVEGCERIKTIVLDLRSFSRLEEDQKQLADLSEGLRTTLRLIRTKYDKQLSFEVDLPENLTLECWPSQLNQVFMNIIVNACQAILRRKETEPELEGVIRVIGERNSGHVRVIFKDNGCGMSETTQRRMFDPFFTTKSVGEGTGMGMSITHRIVEKHSGHLLVESQEGSGSTITVALPAEAISTEEPAPRPA
jgi:signal transduction histidine kinase